MLSFVLTLCCVFRRPTGSCSAHVNICLENSCADVAKSWHIRSLGSLQRPDIRWSVNVSWPIVSRKAGSNSQTQLAQNNVCLLKIIKNYICVHSDLLNIWWTFYTFFKVFFLNLGGISLTHNKKMCSDFLAQIWISAITFHVFTFLILGVLTCCINWK